MFSQTIFLFDSSTIDVKPLNINTSESEFSPFKIGNDFYFTSSKERKIAVTHMDKETEHQFLDIFKGHVFDSATIKHINALTKKINTNVNQGSCFFDKETKRLYYSGDVQINNKIKKYKLAIFSSEFKNNDFGQPKIELQLPDTFQAAHPYLYKGNLYFSANLPNGKGKTDIYCAEKIDNQWTNIKNCTFLNSPENEYFPFILSETEIYFTSNRLGGYGNLDIYKCTKIDTSSSIQNLGSPINSRFDDFSIYIDSTQESGYFSSNIKKNQDDIYFFKQTWPSFKNCTDPVVEDYCYNLTEESTLNTDSAKGYYYQWSFGDGTKEKGLTVRHCFPGPGSYSINLNIIDSVTRAVFMSQASFDLKVDSVIQLKINSLDTVLQNKKFNLNTDWTYLPFNKIKDYYFEVDGRKLRGKSHDVTFKDKGRHKVLLGVVTMNIKTNQKELVCSLKEIVCVDSTTWLGVEQRKIKDIVNDFAFKNLVSDSSLLTNMNFEDEAIKFNTKGLNGNLLSNELKKIVSENLSNKTFNNKNNVTKEIDVIEVTTSASPNSKYLTPVVDTLMDIKEGVGITFKINLGKSKTEVDTTILNRNGINGITETMVNNEYHYTYGNEKKIKDIEKLYNKAKNAGVKSAVVIAYDKNKIIGNQAINITDLFFEAIKIKKDSSQIVKNKKQNINSKSDNTVYNTLENASKDNNKSKNINASNNSNSNLISSTKIIKSIDLNDIQKLNEEYLKEFGDIEVTDLEFKVQVGVYKKRATYNFPKLKGLGKVTNESLNDGSTRMTMGGSYKTLREAFIHNKKIISAGQGDAFVSVYYKGKRIGIENLRRSGVLVKTQVVTDKVSETKLTINASNLTEYKFFVTENEKNNTVIDTTITKNIISSSTTIDTNLNVNIDFIPRTNIQKKTVFYAQKYGAIAADGLEFKVQIAVFKYRTSYAFPNLKALGKIETEKSEEGGVRMLIGGSFKTLNDAFEFNKKVVKAGQTDAFVTIYFEGKRIYVENLERKGIFTSKL